MDTKINKCPLCGCAPKLEKHIYWRHCWPHNTYYQLKCSRCGLSSPYDPSKRGVSYFWNNIKLELF